MSDINKLLDEFEHECFMLRVEATETRVKNDVVRTAHNRIRDEFAERIATTLGRGTCRMEQIPECQYDDIECDKCGVALWAFSMDKDGEGVLATPNYCPNCGARVERNDNE